MNLYNHPNWKTDVKIYKNDLCRFAQDVLGLQLTWQQEKLFKCIESEGSKTSVKYGWGCEKAMIQAFAAIAIWSLAYRENSTIVFLLPNENKMNKRISLRSSKFLEKLKYTNFGYLNDFIQLNDDNYSLKYNESANCNFVREYQFSKLVNPKYKICENYLVIAIDVARLKRDTLEPYLLANASLEQHKILITQKMDTDISRESLYYLSKINNNSWQNLIFSAAQDPLYKWTDQDKIILGSNLKHCLIDGEFYQNNRESETYLINAQQALSCIDSDHCIDLNNGEMFLSIQAEEEEKAVMVLSHKSVTGKVTIMDIPYCKEFDLLSMFDLTQKMRKQYSKLTIIISALGHGEKLIKLFNANAIGYKHVYWGDACYTNDDRKKYVNKRALAYVSLRRAIDNKNFKYAADKKLKVFLKEVLNIPYTVDERHRYKIRTQAEIKDMGLPRLNLCNALAFNYLE